MDRHFDYSQKILVAVEIAGAPRQLAGMPASYALFRRLSVAAVVRAFEESESLFVRLFAGRKFQAVLDQHMSYWERRVAPGQGCYVHYAIGPAAEIEAARARLEGEAWTMLGVYHVEPQSSAYPFAFPTGAAPNHWQPGEVQGPNADSIYWFNFFPAQPHLFEKTFAVWTLFNSLQLREGGECNQLVSSAGEAAPSAHGVEEFVQVNLNRFANLPGYFNAAHEAGKHTFTVDNTYRWYGMLLEKIAAPTA
jgi:hypothetical protein